MRIFTNTTYNFTRWRWHALALSLVLIVAGIAAIVSRGGLPLGIDFSGGTIIVVKFDQDVTEDQVRLAVDPIPGEEVVQQYGDASERELLLVYVVGDRVRVQPRVRLGASVLPRKDRPSRPDVEQAHLDAHFVARALHSAEHDGVGAEFPPRGERDLTRSAGSGHRRVGVAGDEVELALEGKVVPEHLAHRPGDVRRLWIKRNEIRHDVSWRRTGIASDDHGDF